MGIKTVLILHYLFCLYFVFRWFCAMVKPLWSLRHTPPDHILTCMSQTEMEAIQWCLANMKPNEHILWRATTPVDPLLNGYLFPRRIYHGLTKPEEIKARGIRWVFTNFDHGNVRVTKLI